MALGKGGFLNKIRAGQSRQGLAAQPNERHNATLEVRGQQRLIYALCFDFSCHRLPVSVRLFVESSSEGAFSTQKKSVLRAFRLHPQLLSHPPRFMTKEDLTVLDDLLAQDGGGKGEVFGVFSANCLQKLLQTKRFYFSGMLCSELGDDATSGDEALTPSSVLQWQDPVSAQLMWKFAADGAQRLHIALDEPGHWFCLDAEQLFYFDSVRCCLGAIETPVSRQVLEFVAAQSPVYPLGVPQFLRQHRSFLRHYSISEPLALPIVQVQAEVILPQLRLFSDTGSAEVNGRPVSEGACLGFQYCFAEGPPPEFFPCRAEESQKTLFFDGSVYQVQRNFQFEAEVLQRFKSQASSLVFVGEARLVGARPVFDFIAEGRHGWRQWFVEQLPSIKSWGCEVVVDSGFPFHYVSIEQWYGDVTLVEGADKIDWFDFELGVRIDGHAVNLLPSLLALVRRYPARFSLSALADKDPQEAVAIPLPDGRLVDLSVGRLRSVLSVLVELLHTQPLKKDGRLTLPVVQAARLAQLQRQFDDGLQMRGDGELLDRGARVEEIARVDWVLIPDAVQADLRDYQQFGVSWMVALKQYGMGGILADDMGLGKTLQTLAFLAVEKQAGRLNGPALVVLPTSLLFNWQQEIQQFTPSLSCLVYHGARRSVLQDRVAGCDVVLTTYGLVPKDVDFWLGQSLSHLILDEAQNIKNSRAKITQALKRLDAPFRLCLSGTPMENNLAELWSLFDFVLPGYLDSSHRFKKYYREPIEKHGDEEQARALFARVAPFILRRCKSEVASELPPKTETVIHIPLQEQQQDLYEGVCFSIKQNLLADLQGRGEGEGRVLVLNALLTLRQICCDPRLAKLPEEERGTKEEVGSAKLDHVMTMIEALVAEGRKILLFSQFTGMLSLLADRLRQQGLPFVSLTGKSKHRQQLVERFQQGDVPLFLISLKAGGVGLNLTAADTVIHYDPWWNPAAQQQATDRAYRLGQDKPVFVYKLIMEGTVEEKIFQLQARKQLLMDGLNDAVQHRSEQLQLTQKELLAILE